MSSTLFDKIWSAHVVSEEPDGTTILYVDRQLVYEVTSPQAFESLRLSNRKVRRPGATLAVCDHNVPTTDRSGRHRRSRLAPPGGDDGGERAPLRDSLLRSR